MSPNDQVKVLGMPVSFPSLEPVFHGPKFPRSCMQSRASNLGERPFATAAAIDTNLADIAN